MHDMIGSVFHITSEDMSTTEGRTAMVHPLSQTLSVSENLSTSSSPVTCDHTLPLLYLDAVKEGMIHLLVGSYVKKPDSGVFSDWSRNNAYETLRSYWLTYFNLISGQKVETEARF